MEAELNELKSVLRSLVVSSPTQVDVRSLVRDYRAMVGTPLPHARHGYRDPVLFLKEKFNDCFLGSNVNPMLTLIVPDSLKHIDKFVQKQKVALTQKFKEKRKSIPAAVLTPSKNLTHEVVILKQNLQHLLPTPKIENVKLSSPEKSENLHENKYNYDKSSDVTSTDDHILTYNDSPRSALLNFMKKRIPFNLNNELSHDDKDSSKGDADSGRQTSSSRSSSKLNRLEELKKEIKNLIEDHPQRGIWCADLIKLYRERYGRELDITQLGYTCVLGLACELEGTLRVWRPPDSPDWQLQAPSLAPSAELPPTASAAGIVHPMHTHHTPRASHRADPDDALPGVDFDADVYPADCMHYMESIPLPELTELQVGATFEVIVGEVYSPSHLWLIRLGNQYNIAMEDIMDEMTEYYERGAGRERWLARGAVRVGQYCSSCYEGDWHRSLIVKHVDSDTVKVRHVDYGTVERCAVSALRPLPRRWAALPQQAVRARLAALRPPAAGRRWPHAAAAHLLRLVMQRRFVAVLVARENDILEVMLVDTSSAEDVCINSEMIQSGYADPRPDSSLGTSECYLYPSFEALEVSDTPNYAEIHNYLRDGISLDFVEEYRRHVPPCLPGLAAPPASLPEPPPPPPDVRSLSTNLLTSLSQLSLSPECRSSTNEHNLVPKEYNNSADYDKQLATSPMQNSRQFHVLYPKYSTHTSLKSHSPHQSRPLLPNTPQQSHSTHRPHRPLPQHSSYLRQRLHQLHQLQESHSPQQSHSVHRPCPPRLQYSPQLSQQLHQPHTQTQADVILQSKHPDVTLSATECEFFCQLSQVDPDAALRYIKETIECSVAAARAGWQEGERTATESRAVPVQTHSDGPADVGAPALPACRTDQFNMKPAVSSFFNAFQLAPQESPHVRLPPGFEHRRPS